FVHVSEGRVIPSQGGFRVSTFFSLTSLAFTQSLRFSALYQTREGEEEKFSEKEIEMYKVLAFLALVAVSMAAESVQKRQVFLSSSYPGSINTVSYGGYPSVYYGGSPFVYGSPFFGGAPFVTFEQPKEKKAGE
ncbi:hypothetical protein PENTCL1PPCAC_19063, partial [Pristionchus entomophagus]